ncbi:catalase [Salmonella enterica subsp. arizonae]|uniref:Catalase n=1 Tax=Salmonella enterica subsp. arizonae TaxID=59203 RepID=A0A379TL84_SALER|nr:catalase [Salmonella enterica subsp. arizonae]
MGPKARYIGTGKWPKEDLIWQDPLPQPLYQPTQEDIIKPESGDRCIRLSVSGDGFGCLGIRVYFPRRR